MILLQIDPQRRTVLPFEGDAPGAVDVDRVTLRPAAQGVEVETRLDKLRQRCRVMQRIEPDQNALAQIGGHPARGAGLEQVFQALVPEARNHGRSVMCYLSYVKRYLTLNRHPGPPGQARG